MLYICLDCEASGPMAPLYNLLSIGATAVHAVGDEVGLGEDFYVELRPIFPGVDPQAVAVCGLDVEQLKETGTDPQAAMRALADWVGAQSRRAGFPPVFVGHNAVFDWAYIAYYFAHFSMPNPFGYKGIDTKSLAMGVLGVDWEETGKESLERLLRLPPQDPGQVHRADYDARYQAEILKALLLKQPPKSLDTPGGRR